MGADRSQSALGPRFWARCTFPDPYQGVLQYHYSSSHLTCGMYLSNAEGGSQMSPSMALLLVLDPHEECAQIFPLPHCIHH